MATATKMQSNPPVASWYSSLGDQRATRADFRWPRSVCVLEPDFRSRSCTRELPMATATRQWWVAIGDMSWQYTWLENSKSLTVCTKPDQSLQYFKPYEQIFFSNFFSLAFSEILKMQRLAPDESSWKYETILKIWLRNSERNKGKTRLSKHYDVTTPACTTHRWIYRFIQHASCVSLHQGNFAPLSITLQRNEHVQQKSLK